MSEQKHTPGPWTWNGKDMPYADITDANGCVVAGVNECDCATDADARREERANARLIASAPDLLAALRTTDAAMRAHPGGDCRSAEDIEAARRAIARAEGREV